MGALVSNLRMREPRLVPPSAWAGIFRRTCLQNHFWASPQSLRSLVVEIQDLNHKSTPTFSIVFDWNLPIFVNQEPMQNFETLAAFFLVEK